MNTQLNSQQPETTVTHLRPQMLADFTGQPKVTAQLEIALKAAQMRGEGLEHALMYGPAGTGKTTISYIIANELGVQAHTIAGPSLTNPQSLLGVFLQVKPFDVLFIDEIHRIPIAVEEMLYSAMEDFKLDVVLDKGITAQSMTLPVNRFTLVGATTRLGDLSAPLRTRFGLSYQFELYDVNELVNIVLRSSKALEVGCDPDAAVMIAQRARGTPRVANRLLKRCRDFAHAIGANHVTAEIAGKALDLEGVDQHGLNRMDYIYLEALIRNGGLAGVDALAANINETADTLVDVIEPHLLRQGYISRTRTGRKAMETAYQLLGKTMPSPKKEFRLF